MMLSIDAPPTFRNIENNVEGGIPIFAANSRWVPCSLIFSFR